MRIVAISDTHGSHDEILVPPGDVFIHAGDSCNYGYSAELKGFAAWLAHLPHKHKIIVAGNHDWAFSRTPSRAVDLIERAGAIYLEDATHTIDGVVFYGAPWQPEFNGWAFNLPRNGPELRAKWAKIPQHVDVLITHGPPWGEGLDRDLHGNSLGDMLLRDALTSRVVRNHVFGHIHAGYGEVVLPNRRSMNVSICNADYIAENKPTVFDVEVVE